jgi:hypothetical protein
MKPGRHFSAAIVRLLCASILAAGLTACSGNRDGNVTSAVTAGPASAVSSAVTSAAAGVSTEKSADTKQMAYIKSFDTGSDALVIDPIEWITKEDTERIKELGLKFDYGFDDFPDGHYIYNPSQETEMLKLARDARLFMIRRGSSGPEGNEQVSLEQFAQRIKQEDSYPYQLTLENGEVSELQERYVP